jgi:PAS domain S-box-containing protein
MAQVADLIDKNREHIQRQYCEQVARFPSARGLSPNELLDTLPEYLTTLVQLLRGNDPEAWRATRSRLEETHISHRLRVGYNQEEVTSEYVILGRILAELWAGLPPEEAPAPEEPLHLNQELEHALDHVIAVFSGYTFEHRQAEKRTLRRLDALATALLEDAPDKETLEKRFAPLVEVVQEAMGAQAAAVLLARDEGQQLLPVAYTGGWSALEEYAPLPVDPRTFLGQVASIEEPILLPDAARPALAVSEGVRGSGMRSLLGLRLWPQGRLLGVLCIGYAEVRTVEPQARRYFETLIEYLSGIIQKALLLQQVRESQQRSERSETMLRTVIETLPVGVWVADETRRLILSNAATRHIWAGERLVGIEGYAEYEGRWLDTGERITPEEWGLSRAVTRGESSGEQYARIRAFDGTEKVIRMSSAPLRDASGHIFGAIALNEDVTRLKEVEQALQESEREYRTLSESMPQVVWTARPDGGLDYVSQSLADYIGRSVEEALGLQWYDLVHPDDLTPTVERWQRSLASGEVYQVEHRLQRADGAYRWFLTRAVSMQGPGGRPLKWFGTSTDIEDIKRAEDELRRRAEFEQQLVGIVSHDLRNPLNAIQLATVTLLRRHGMDERQRTIISRVQSSADRAIRMIRDLLDFTQARLGGGIPIDRKALDLRGLTVQVVDEVRLAHPDRSLEVACGEEALGEWDPDRVAQVLTNLMSNALHYSPPGTPVRVTLRGEAEAVVLEVNNQGEPIPASVLPRLFEPLERGTRKDQASRSIGLGLFIVKSIVLAHGGTVEVRSTAAEGTTFAVRLPRRPSLSPEAQPTLH